MIETDLIVRIACDACHTIFDVDLAAVAAKRGPLFSLIDREVTCRISCCRGQSHFIAARSLIEPFLVLTTNTSDMTPAWLSGLRPIDTERPLHRTQLGPAADLEPNSEASG